jgi:pimeloyl-ACP methyl ester carboxylesterase
MLASIVVADAAPRSVESSDGVRIEYEVMGDHGPALVFVHGWSCDRSYWSGQLEPLARTARVIAIDLAGHGGSGGNRASWTMEAFAADVSAVVRQLDLDKVVLIGHSMGTDVIIEAARQMPDRVAGLVWVDRYNRLDQFRSEEAIARLIAPFRSDFVSSTRAYVRHLFPETADTALVERVVKDMSSAPVAVALPALEATLAHENAMPAALKALQVPSVAINAGYEPTDVQSMNDRGVEVIIMSGVGHFLMMEQPARFNALLMQAIGKF